MFEKVKANLEARGFAVSCFEAASKAVEYLNGVIDGATVGIGGSMTVKEMGLYERLKEHNAVSWHLLPSEGKSTFDVIAEANASDIYISSVNGLAETGEIINIDGTCNRIATILYGHKKVYLIAGVNKLAPDYDSALHRARNIAAPLNAKRLNKRTPCAVNADRCYDCESPERICRGLSVLWEKPGRGEYEIVLVNEKLGY